MKITLNAYYALEIAVHLAMLEAGESLSLLKLSQRVNLSISKVDAILKCLKAAEIVRSVKGAKGGFKLADRADFITFGQVIRACNQSLYPVYCSDPYKKNCMSQCICSLNAMWNRVGENIGMLVDVITLQKLITLHAKEIAV